MENLSARYAQVEILPLSPQAVCDALRLYAQHRAPEALDSVEAFVDEFRKILKSERFPDVVELVSRPVHLPMLVSLLRRRFVSPADLTRSLLYSDFVDAIIDRESMKRSASFQALYPTEARRGFAKRLAVEMWRRGEQRSIRTTEIPDYLFEPFVGSGRSLEAVRRDLVASCFFERKSPDILFAAHKSFLEYLAAEAIVDAIVLDDDQSRAGLDLAITDEVASFALEIIGRAEWQSFLQPNRASRGLLRRVTKLLASGSATLPPEAEEDIYCVIETIDETSLQRIVTYFGAIGFNMSKVAHEIVMQSLHHPSDMVAVEAFRVLERLGWLPDGAVIRERVGGARIVHWLRMGWLKRPVFVAQDLKGKAKARAQRDEKEVAARFERALLPATRDVVQALIQMRVRFEG